MQDFGSVPKQVPHSGTAPKSSNQTLFSQYSYAPQTDKSNGNFRNPNSVPNSETQTLCHQFDLLDKSLFANPFAILLSAQSEILLGGFTHELADFHKPGYYFPHDEETSFWAALVPSVSDIVSRHPEQTS